MHSSGMNRPLWQLSDFKDREIVHEGYASLVFKATCRHSRQKVALKIYHPEKLHPMSQHQLMREARLHPTLDHPNIVKMYASFVEQGLVVMVTEWCDGGDLHRLHHKCKGRIPEKTAAAVTRQLLKALAYLHSKDIVHRDIKLENIVLSRDPKSGEMIVKLADFGLAISLREEPCAVTRVGTTDYMAPEVLRCPIKDDPLENKQRTDIAYSQSVDVWSLAVLAFEMVNGRPPFPRPKEGSGVDTIPSQHILSLTSRPPRFIVRASEEMMDFVYACLVPAASRPSAEQFFLSHPWVCKSSKTASSSSSSSCLSRAAGPSTACSSVNDVAMSPFSIAAQKQFSRMLTDTSSNASETPASATSAFGASHSSAPFPSPSDSPSLSHSISYSRSVADFAPFTPLEDKSQQSRVSATNTSQKDRTAAAAAAANDLLEAAAAMIFDARASAPAPMRHCNAQCPSLLGVDACEEGEEGEAFARISLSQPGAPV